MHFAVPTPGSSCCVTETLQGPEGDARTMAAIARDAGFWTWEPLMGGRVTRSAVLGSLRAAARLLRRGDILLVTYSGHGCQIDSDDERDGYDETWCLADGQLVDDDLHQELAGFEAGVRILVISASCHAGGIVTLLSCGPVDMAARRRSRAEVVADRLAQLDLPPGLARLVLPRRAERIPIRADVLLLAACSEGEVAEDRVGHSLFIGELLNVWNTFPEDGTYEDFIVAVHDRVAIENPEQHPGIALFGGRDAAFLGQRPFTI